MSIRDEVRYKKATLQKEAPELEKARREIEKDIKILQELVDIVYQWKETRDKMLTSEDPVKASNAKFYDATFAVILAVSIQMFKWIHLAVEIYENTEEIHEILESVNTEEATEEELRQASADASKIAKILKSKIGTLEESHEAFKEANPLFRDENSDIDPEKALGML